MTAARKGTETGLQSGKLLFSLLKCFPWLVVSCHRARRRFGASCAWLWVCLRCQLFLERDDLGLHMADAAFGPVVAAGRAAVGTERYRGHRWFFHH